MKLSQLSYFAFSLLITANQPFEYKNIWAHWDIFCKCNLLLMTLKNKEIIEDHLIPKDQNKIKTKL